MRTDTSTQRFFELRRTTKETDVKVALCINGGGRGEISTGIGFLDHLLATLVHHARFDLKLECKGDLHVDDHHTVEDCALSMGEALARALGERIGLVRFASAYAPLDEALSRAVIDLAIRPFAVLDLGLRRAELGSLACENVAHFLRSFATAGRFNLHVDVLRGENDHHRAESAFKATALVLRRAVERESEMANSLKGQM